MGITNLEYQTFLQILQEELVPAMGCTEPIALAYCAALARKHLGYLPNKVLIEVSGNILKNVKSVVVPNTNGQKGIEAAVAAGLLYGKPELVLQVISEVTEEEKNALPAYMENTEFVVETCKSDEVLDIRITAYNDDVSAKVRIARSHSFVTLIEKNNE